MPRKRKKSPRRKIRRKNRPQRSPILKWGGAGILLLMAVAALYVVYLNHLIQTKFDGKRWALPAVVYARPLELYPGLAITPELLIDELQLAGYRHDRESLAPAGYQRQGNLLRVVTREFNFPGGLEKSLDLTLSFSGNRLQSITSTESGQAVSGARLDPARIGSFHPKEHEDRLLLTRRELPDLLVKTLLAVEDQHFYSHIGLDPLAIARAMLVNLRAGKTVQGGSTLTQQLVKNFFLTNRRTLWRKANEAIMALLLEAHYDKEEILTAYGNEIFLGQDGGRAVHGFGLASQFYFRRDLKDLAPAQIALLIGIVRGPSYYNPRTSPERCLKRRQVVLDIMRDRRLLDEAAFREASAAALTGAEVPASGFNRFPAFLDLVRRQLRQDYREADLTSEGLKIFTTLDPQIQHQVESQLAASIVGLEKHGIRPGLEGAVVITNRDNGEILALAGGRTPRQSGFNRALDAKRSIGSLIKPAVYLTALANGSTLATPVEDTAVTIDNVGSKPWRPRNFDHLEHGRVPLYAALAHSYNLATVRIGMAAGVENVVRTVRALGVDRPFRPYPSFLLGAVAMTPLEVTKMYQTLAAGGFSLPQRAISSVLAADHRVIKRFGLSVEQRFAPELIYLLNTGLQLAVAEGTGQSLARYISPTHKVAGKTGTSDDLRDSWFAGFTGDKLAVVWLGRDDNQPVGLTGATGALVAWGEIMRALEPQPLELTEPVGVQWFAVDVQFQEKGRGRYVHERKQLPFLAGSAPATTGPSAADSNRPVPERPRGRFLEKILNWFR